jgi:hypothetical protein
MLSHRRKKFPDSITEAALAIVKWCSLLARYQFRWRGHLVIALTGAAWSRKSVSLSALDLEELMKDQNKHAAHRVQ